MSEPARQQKKQKLGEMPVAYKKKEMGKNVFSFFIKVDWHAIIMKFECVAIAIVAASAAAHHVCLCVCVGQWGKGASSGHASSFFFFFPLFAALFAVGAYLGPPLNSY